MVEDKNFLIASIPETNTFWITQARIPEIFLRDQIFAARDFEGSVLANVRVDKGVITQIQSWLDGAIAPEPNVPLSGRHLWPTLVDVHTHIDKSQVISRIGPTDGSFRSAREAINFDRIKYWTKQDLRTRMEFSIKCAYVHGTTALRTHIDSYQGQAELSWMAFSELRDEWAGRMELQATASVPIDVFSTEYGRQLADLAATTNGGLLGGVLRRSSEPDYTYLDNINDLLDAQFNLAKEHGLNIDLHVDETISSDVCHLEDVARAVIRHKMKGRVVCSHCCSLAAQTDDKLDAVLTVCAEAGVSIVTLPTTNSYLLDRKAGRTPRLRGLAPIHEIRARDIPIAIGSDNIRDALYPFGDYDMVENFRQSVMLYHLDQHLGGSLAMLGPAPAAMMGAPAGSIAAGLSANLILFNARSIGEIVSRPQADRMVLSHGRRVSETLPNIPAQIVED